MADNTVRRRGVAEGAEFANSKDSGFTVDPGPYEAVVVKHAKSTRMGQLQVWIPDWGGNKEDPANQVVVSYASPFYGTTYGTGSQERPQGPWSNGMSYGMWCVPPDVGNKVLVTFAAGDRNRGYWFACIYDGPTHHMVPANGRNVGGEGNTLVDDSTKEHETSDSVFPVSEYNTNEDTAFLDLDATDRYAHPYQTAVLVNQGLDRDPVRGAISSSSMREAPSNVYGISTPGRNASTRAVSDPGADEVSAEETVAARLGGHSFVMDDGDKDGVDRLIRLRTSGGHQILMNDSEHILYIASDTGNQWIEFSKAGHINVYGIAGINMSSKGPINMFSESAVIIDSNGAVQIRGEKGVNISSLVSCSMSALVSASVTTDGLLALGGVAGATLSAGGALNLSSIGLVNVAGGLINLNCSPPLPPKPAIPTIPVFAGDVKWDGKLWSWVDGGIDTICSLVPRHEPWLDPATGERPKPQAAGGGWLGIAVGAVASFGAGALTPGMDLATAAINTGTGVATGQAINIAASNALKK